MKIKGISDQGIKRIAQASENRDELINEAMTEAIEKMGEIAYEMGLSNEEYQEMGIRLAKYILD